MLKHIETILSATAMLIVVSVLAYTTAITFAREEPTTVQLPPAEKNQPIRPEVQRLIDELRKATQAPAFYRIPFVPERKHEKVLM